MYKAICNADELVSLSIRKVLKRKLSARALPKLILYKVMLSRYRAKTRKLLKKVEKIGSQEPLQEAFEALNRSLGKAYAGPLEIEEMLKQKIETL